LWQLGKKGRSTTIEIRPWLAAAILLASVVFGIGRLDAVFVRREIENVPIERLTQNLERRARENPRDVETRINLGRVHAMAYALKSETAPVLKSGNPNEPLSNEPEFGVITSQFANVQVQPAIDAATMNQAREHLIKPSKTMRPRLL